MTEENKPPKREDNKNKAGSDFIQGSLSSVVGWFDHVPKTMKWIVSCFFLYLVFCFVAQIDPKGPFVTAGEAISDMVSTRRATNAEINDENKRRFDLVISLLTDQLARERDERLKLAVEIREDRLEAERNAAQVPKSLEILEKIHQKMDKLEKNTRRRR